MTKVFDRKWRFSQVSVKNEIRTHFDAISSDFRYQLTAVLAIVYVALKQRRFLFFLALFYLLYAERIIRWNVPAGNGATDFATGVEIVEQSLAMTCVQESSGHRPQDC
jgi:hypothetical protein